MIALPWTLLLAALAASGPEVQGHRGARAVYPENSLVGFDYALSVGVDTLELDLGVTKDGVLVVNHDPYVDPARCLDAEKRRLPEKIPLRSLTLADIQRFDCGALGHPRFPKQKRVPNTKIPTLDEVIDLVLRSKHPAAKTVNLNVETKIFPAHPSATPTPELFARLVVERLKARKMIRRTIVQSFDHRTLVAAKKLAPKLRIAFLQPDGFPPYGAIAKSLGAEIISPHHEWITKAAVDDLHRDGVRVIPWTANDERAWARLLELGVDGIITDDPAALIRFLRKRKIRP